MTIELSEYVIDAIANAVVKKMQKPNKGHWIETSVLVRSCSSCGKGYSEYPVGKWNYCPNCGAKMVESEDEECTKNI